MTSWAKPGVKCVCVRVSGWRRHSGPPYVGPYPELGATYTIENVGIGDGMLFLTLVEFGHCVRFWVDRFRPLITKTQEQDTEMFLRIANDTPFHVMIDEELYPID